MIRRITVPLEDLEAERDYVLGHVGLTKEGYDFLTEAVANAGLNGTTEDHAKAEELLRQLLDKKDDFIDLWNAK